MHKYLSIIWTFLKTFFSSKSAEKRGDRNHSQKGGPNIIVESGRGGNGGSPTIHGNNGVAIGGPGGAGGQYGRGGDGGGDVHIGDNLFAMGGEGGEAAQHDKGGKGGRSPFEILGIPNRQLPDGTWLWDKGRGGDGASPSSTKK